MGNPEFSDVDGKLQAKFSVWYDGDKDGKPSGSVSIVAEVDKVEALKELISKVASSESAPQWLKDIFKGMLPPAA